MTRPSRVVLVPAAALWLLATACGGDDTSSSATTEAAATTAPAAAGKGDITVFAAASLTAAFTEIGDAFGAEHTDAEVTFSFDASSTLVRQITQGAPADLFASVDTANMDKLVAAGLNGSEPVVFATNKLEIVVGAGNPKGLSGLVDLAQPGLKVVLCAAEVPCGKYAAQSLQAAGVTLTPASLERNVKGVVTKVTAGEADAGIVYSTDVKAAGDEAEGVEIPASVNVIAEYPIAPVETSAEADVNKALIAFLTGSEGQAILAKYGFGAP